MEVTFRWMLLGFVAGLWLSLEETQCNIIVPDQNSNTSRLIVRSFFCNNHCLKACLATCLLNETHPVQVENENGPDGVKDADLHHMGRGKPSPQKGRPTAPIHTDTEDKQCVCRPISLEDHEDHIGLTKCDVKMWMKCNCSHNCCIVCHKEHEITHAVTTKIASSSQQKNSSDVKWMSVSMEKEPYPVSKRATSNRDGKTKSFCCNTHSVKSCVMMCLFNFSLPLRADTDNVLVGNCVESEIEQPLLQCGQPQDSNICRYSHHSAIGSPNTYFGAVSTTGSANNHDVCISLESGMKKNDEDVRWYCCNCIDNCCTVCDKGQLNSDNTNTILLILLLLVVVVIIVAVVLFMRKRKFSGRSEVSMTRTNQNEAVSSGYETTVRDNHYELSGAGVPIYTELELTQQPAPSNNTVYANVQPTGEAIDMGKRVVYAELDNVAVAVSPVYSQPFESETSASNTEYAEPFKPDNKSTATAPVSNLYDNIAAVDQQNVYSLAEAIPLSDPNVIYSQPNKPKK